MLYVVIPVFNRRQYTRDCLLSLRQQTRNDFRVVVVDDGSTDGTAQMLAEEFPEVEVVPGSGQLFWTAGVNAGIRRALALHATCVMTMNNDVLALPDFMAQMLAAAEGGTSTPAARCPAGSPGPGAPTPAATCWPSCLPPSATACTR